MDIFERVREVIADITQNSIEEITEHSNSKNVDGWDAIAQINILVTLEMDFGVSFLPKQMETLTSVKKIMGVIKLQAAA